MQEEEGGTYLAGWNECVVSDIRVHSANESSRKCMEAFLWLECQGVLVWQVGTA